MKSYVEIRNKVKVKFVQHYWLSTIEVLSKIFLYYELTTVSDTLSSLLEACVYVVNVWLLINTYGL